MKKHEIYEEIVSNYKQVKSNWRTLLELCQDNDTYSRYKEIVGTYSAKELDQITKYATYQHSRLKRDLEYFLSVTVAMLEISEQEINNQLNIMDYKNKVAPLKESR
jgi:hypothetical protein